jgi:hypothetical protein
MEDSTMTNQSQDQSGSSWLVEPPGPGEVHFEIALGEGLTMTEETQQAIEALLKQILGGETEGYAAGCYPKCADLKNCGVLECTSLNNCKPLKQQPCLALMSCTIGKIM